MNAVWFRRSLSDVNAPMTARVRLSLNRERDHFCATPYEQDEATAGFCRCAPARAGPWRMRESDRRRAIDRTARQYACASCNPHRVSRRARRSGPASGCRPRSGPAGQTGEGSGGCPGPSDLQRPGCPAPEQLRLHVAQLRVGAKKTTIQLQKDEFGAKWRVLRPNPANMRKFHASYPPYRIPLRYETRY